MRLVIAGGRPALACPPARLCYPSPPPPSFQFDLVAREENAAAVTTNELFSAKDFFFTAGIMREIVHLQAGQCGNQIGAKVGLISRFFAAFPGAFPGF